ncbi:MAG: hypothetical protein ABIL01_23380 [Pseudomonadota bacterium]
MSIDTFFACRMHPIGSRVSLKKGRGAIQGDVKDGYPCTRFDVWALTDDAFSLALRVWQYRRYFRVAVVAALRRPHANLR